MSILRTPPGVHQVFYGKIWPPLCTEDSIRSASTMKPRSDDIFICTYPKSGTTWIQHIVHQLLGKNRYDESAEEETGGMYMFSPMIEHQGASFADSFESPRVLKSHFSYSDMPKGGGAKYIYSCRNPKDCLVSYYHHHKNFKWYDVENLDFDVFFESFLDGQVGHGDYFDHLISWLNGIESGKEEILLLKYEDMVSDLHSTVVRIATFLGGNAAELVKHERCVKQIVKSSSIGSMKKKQERWFPKSEIRDGAEFIRKGGSRDWKNNFSLEKSNRMDQIFRQRCAETPAMEWWGTEMDWTDGSLSNNPINASHAKEDRHRQ